MSNIIIFLSIMLVVKVFSSIKVFSRAKIKRKDLEEIDSELPIMLSVISPEALINIMNAFYFISMVLNILVYMLFYYVCPVLAMVLGVMYVIITLYKNHIANNGLRRFLLHPHPFVAFSKFTEINPTLQLLSCYVYIDTIICLYTLLYYIK